MTMARQVESIAATRASYVFLAASFTLTVMTCRDTPDHESHDRPPLPPALLPPGEKGVS
jgi:hypothetical protein